MLFYSTSEQVAGLFQWRKYFKTSVLYSEQLAGKDKIFSCSKQLCDKIQDVFKFTFANGPWKYCESEDSLTHRFIWFSCHLVAGWDRVQCQAADLSWSLVL